MELTSRQRLERRRAMEEKRNRDADKRRKASEKVRTPTIKRQQEMNREKARERYGASELEARAKRQAAEGGSDAPRARMKPSAPAKATEPSEKRPTTIAEARKMGSKFYYKDGKKMAAVTAEQLEASGYDSLRAYMNAWKDPKNPPKKEKKSEFRDSPRGAVSEKGLYSKGGMAKKKKMNRGGAMIGANMTPARQMKSGMNDYRGKK